MNNLDEVITRLFKYDSYGEYLQSIEWKIIRNRILNRDQHKCQAYKCTARAEVIHHRDYSDQVMLGNKDDQLVSLCAECHRRAHANARGQNHLEKANRWIKTGTTKKPKKLIKLKKKQKQEAKWTNWRTR